MSHYSSVLFVFPLKKSDGKNKLMNIWYLMDLIWPIKIKLVQWESAVWGTVCKFKSVTPQCEQHPVLLITMAVYTWGGVRREPPPLWNSDSHGLYPYVIPSWTFVGATGVLKGGGRGSNRLKDGTFLSFSSLDIWSNQFFFFPVKPLWGGE